MKAIAPSRISFPRQLALVLLASALALPVLAQQGQSATTPQSTPPVAVDQQPSPQPPPAVSSPSINTPREGFWGRVNPFARKKWVNNRVNPLKGQLNELDEVNAKNSRDIQDVDGRAQAGIRRAQSTADAANEAATAAGSQARNAGSLAQGASSHVDQLNSTVTGLDQYRQSNEVEIAFHGGQSILSAAARKQLDELAANLTGHMGYILEIEGHSPQTGAAGIQNSGRLADAVKRYLVTEHQIPVYRLHSVALGNASTAGNEDARPARVSSVHVRLMEKAKRIGR
jgi:outer membrane protein OmpA-like peptidoglycan-associated protein